jgi:NAD(P)H-hydrate epimerase
MAISPIRLLPAARMRALDERAIGEVGIPGAVLMEQAGRGAVRMIVEAGWLKHRDDPVLILAGKGNNGGDGLVVARVLLLAGYRRVRVGLLAAREQVRGDARTNLEAFLKLGGTVVEIADAAAWEDLRLFEPSPALVVDGLLGTGLKSEVRGLYAVVIAAINAFSGPVLALDIPSGLDADSGRPLGSAVRAAATATFAFGKPGLYVTPGKSFAGRVEIIDIGIPAAWAEKEAEAVLLLTADYVRSLLPEALPADAHKGRRGHLLLFAGRPGFTGAGLLAAGAGLYAGCGLATLALPAPAAAAIEGSNPALMLCYLPENEERSGPGPLPESELFRLLENRTAVVAGPGFGLGKGAGELLAGLIAACGRKNLPLLLDADALTLLAADPGLLPPDHGPLVLTPHPGEMARLLATTSAEIQQQRLAAARELAGRFAAWVVLKGAASVIAAPDGRLAINTSGNSLLATAGSGDVLSGVIGSFLARGLTPARAVSAGVFLHGRVADRFSDSGRKAGITAVEIRDGLPAALAELAAGGGCGER